MKKVYIVYRNKNNAPAIDYIKKDFEEVFTGTVDFENLFLEEMSNKNLEDGDAFIVMEFTMFNDLKDHKIDVNKIIKVTRSYNQEKLKQIFKLPTNTTALVINDTYNNTIDTIHGFYEAGIGHINMVPFDDSLAKTGRYNNIAVAITPGETELVPETITKIIDIGYRPVGFDTMLKLMKMLNIELDVVRRNLFRQVDTSDGLNSLMPTNYVYNYLKTQMLSYVVSSSNTGMILSDRSFNVVYANDTALHILNNVKKDKISLEDYISPIFLASDDMEPQNIKVNGENYYCQKQPIMIMDEVAGFYITLKDEREITLNLQEAKKMGYIAKHRFKDIIHISEKMNSVIELAKKIAQSDETILIRGESGTGKELMAQSIHNASKRSTHPFVAINCAALPESLLESELFGYDEGAFTGAQKGGKVGLFQKANHGTLFLDEIGNISAALQAKLLRTIQEKEIMKVGSNKIVKIDIRLITATNRDLEKAVEEGEFRSDLYFRLNVLPINIPPLRERTGDILGLLKHFLGNDFDDLSTKEIDSIVEYDWPGNVRELENTVIYYKTLSQLPDYVKIRHKKMKIRYTKIR